MSWWQRHTAQSARNLRGDAGADTEGTVSRQGEPLSILEAAVSNNDRHVVPNPRGGWNVVNSGAGHASSHHDTQADAIVRGRQIVHNAGGGELRIHGRDGQIRDSDTIAPGRDPNPPRDTR